ncbi:xanthine dehydrogenase family protein molybdopterin-binding subunit [Terriglobus albidus]|uniref:Xanthine dehydrogenase family protein molybdopterin-binding subunit n=1 Tax=Terriglobus albidus TaxID=1592106 RepID=A0A5B9E8J9_9BACT|nr:xanthine dehydrogenase family protein molybdopterin-binding subunit [Terriglobus albidus]QEE26910.1 xanthine dehydrogenase family protein molybdopterin-binding subunit [Terriglobus albidus]
MEQQKPQPVTESKIVGVPTPRIDGPLKTTGAAMYSSDHHFPGLVYAWPVTATIASGTISGIDASAAEKMPGVLAIYTHKNIGPLYRTPPSAGFSMILDERRPPLEDETVSYYGQYVAVAVAHTVEQARAAAEAVKVTYAKTPHNTNDKLLDTPTVAGKPKEVTKRGDAAAALAGATYKHDAVYSTPAETHNPIELHASVAVYKDGKFTLYETSQAVVNHRDVMAAMLGVPPENVQVITRFLGSGFGGKLWPWPHAMLAAASARNLNRPVKLVVSRSMMFQSVGHRPTIDQRVQLAADKSGKLLAIRHDYVNHTSMLDDYDEGCAESTGFMYSCPNVLATSGLVRRNVGTPTSMRGPGAVPGLYAFESAMDELAIKLDIDPVQLRLLNEPEKDESTGQPFSSRHLKECLTVGAEKFGWAKRNPAIGLMKDAEGRTLGWGVAACTWIATRTDAEVNVELRQDGTARVTCGTQDIGGGTYTAVAQMVSHETGIPLQRTDVVMGDSGLPPGPISGGSWATASVVPAALQAAQQASKQLLLLATKTDGCPFKGKSADELEFVDGVVRMKGQTSGALPFGEILKAANVRSVSATGKSTGLFGDPNQKFSFHSYGAQFAEVTWQPEIARLRVSRVVTVIDAGRMVNPRAARNQIEGAVVMGVGMAMLEATEYDQRSGAPINASLADYIVAVNADCPAIDVTFLDYPDFNLNPLGARGVGEIGLAGIAAAITNAVHHATGIRVRNLPLRIEDLLVSPRERKLV